MISRFTNLCTLEREPGMHNAALEETALTDNTNEPQPDISEPSSTPQPETPEPETTALVPTPTEQDVIEGEVIVLEPPEAPKAHTLPKQKPYWLLIPSTIVCCLIFLAGSYLLPLLTPTATVTIIPVERTITTTTVIQIHGRQLPALTLMQRLSVQATGKGHQNARQAHGIITFYNGSFSSQTIAAGTLLTGRDGIQIITDQVATIPAGNPPIYGQVSVSAHAILAGEQGNIPAYDINQACCATSVLAKNTQAFTGGAAARDFLVVTRTDINNAVASLLITLSQVEAAAQKAQLHQGEDLITPSCTPSISSDHKPGDEAKQVVVTVSITCSGIAYDAHEVYQDATQILTTEAANRFGTGYSLTGDIQITIVHATISNQTRAHIMVQVTGTWIYQITPTTKRLLLHLIAGKSKQQAEALLLQFPGIAGAQILVKGENQTLPEDP